MIGVEDLFEEAIRIEEEGASFYRTLMTKARSSAAKKMFRALAQDEERHQKIFTEMKGAFGRGDKYSVGSEIRLRNLPIFPDLQEEFGRRIEHHRVFYGDSGLTVIDALAMARSAEMRSIAHYRRMMEREEFDVEGRKALEMIIAEEIIHLKLIEIQHEHLKSSGFWFESEEFFRFRSMKEEELRSFIEEEMPSDADVEWE